MPTLEVPDDMYQRVENFTAVVQAVMDEDTDTAACFGIVLELGLEAALNQIIHRQKESVLVQTIQQLAEKDPKLVYGHVADMVGLGADLRKQHGRRQIGFRRT